MPTTNNPAPVTIPSREVPLIEGEELIKVGHWYWYRNVEGELIQVVFPDLNFGEYTYEEAIKLLEQARQ